MVIECDDDGRVTSIVVVMQSQEAAQVIAETINKELDKGDDYDVGVLCRATSATIGGEKHSLSMGVLPCVLFVAVLGSFIVA